MLNTPVLLLIKSLADSSNGVVFIECIISYMRLAGYLFMVADIIKSTEMKQLQPFLVVRLNLKTQQKLFKIETELFAIAQRVS